MPPQQQGIMEISQLLGRRLTPVEDAIMWRMMQERMDQETEMRRLANEQQKLQLEGEKVRQSAITRALEFLQPRWEYAGEPVDVGEFQGQQVAVGPGGVRPFGPQTQFVQPGIPQQRMAQQLGRTTLGLPAEDPMEKFTRELEKLSVQEQIKGRQARETEEFRIGLEEKREKGKEKREEFRAGKVAKLEETKETARLRRDLQTKVETSMDKAKKAHSEALEELRKDPMFKTLPPVEQKSQLAELREEYEDWIDTIAERARIAAKNYGIEFELPNLPTGIDISQLSTEQIARYKKLSKKDKRRLAELYEQEYGKRFPMEVD